LVTAAVCYTYTFAVCLVTFTFGYPPPRFHAVAGLPVHPFAPRLLRLRLRLFRLLPVCWFTGFPCFTVGLHVPLLQFALPPFGLDYGYAFAFRGFAFYTQFRLRFTRLFSYIAGLHFWFLFCVYTVLRLPRLFTLFVTLDLRLIDCGSRSTVCVPYRWCRWTRSAQFVTLRSTAFSFNGSTRPTPRLVWVHTPLSLVSRFYLVWFTLFVLDCRSFRYRLPVSRLVPFFGLALLHCCLGLPPPTPLGLNYRRTRLFWLFYPLHLPCGLPLPTFLQFTPRYPVCSTAAFVLPVYFLLHTTAACWFCGLPVPV